MWWFTPTAAALPASTTETCSPSVLEATMPVDGDVGVLPDAVIALVFGGGDCGGKFFEGDLVTDLHGPVRFAIEDTDAALLRIVPEAPFVAGDTVHLQGQTGSGVLELSFTIGEDGLALTGEPTAIEVDAEVICDGLAFTSVTGTVRLGAPGSGLLQRAVVSEGVSGGWSTVGAVNGRASLGFTAEVLGAGREHCVDVRLLDEAGAVAWEVEGDCATAAACPEEERSADGAGCATTTPGVGGGAALALVALLARRRSRCG